MMAKTTRISTGSSADRNYKHTPSRRHNSLQPEKAKSGSSSSSSRLRRRSDNTLPSNYSSNMESNGNGSSYSLNRSNSHASSTHSRKSSLGSTGNTAYSTPLHSPALKKMSSRNDNSTEDDDEDEYSSPIPNPKHRQAFFVFFFVFCVKKGISKCLPNTPTQRLIVLT